MTGQPPPLPGRRSSGRRTPGEMFSQLAGEDRLRRVPITAVQTNPDQPRKRFDPDALDALADSIAERGILQPPVVRETSPGAYLLIAGERRWRAAQLAGLTEIDVLLRDEKTAGHTLEDALLENTARQDLTAVEEARAYRLLIEDLGISQAELGRRVGRSRQHISNHLRLLELPDEILELVETDQLTFGHARALLAFPDDDTRTSAAQQAVTEQWSVRAVERAARDHTHQPAGATTPAPGETTRGRDDDHATALARTIGERVGAPVTVRVKARAITVTARRPDAARAFLAALGATLEDDASDA